MTSIRALNTFLIRETSFFLHKEGSHPVLGCTSVYELFTSLKDDDECRKRSVGLRSDSMGPL